jgi:hypothetical protein
MVYIILFMHKYLNSKKRIWGTVGSGNGEFLHTHGITIDLEDNVYVSDGENCNIQKFDNNGDFLTMWGSLGCKNDQFLIPHDIGIDSKGYLYVTY